MSIDQELRQAATATYRAVGRPDVDAALHTFHAARRRRQRTRFVAVVATVAGSVLAGGMALWGPYAQAPTVVDPAPATRPGQDSPAREPALEKSDGWCDAAAIRCLGSDAFFVDGRVRYTVTAAGPTWTEPDVGTAPETVDVYQRKRDAGVTFLVNPRAARAGRIITSASALAHWVAQRPFLEPTTAERTLVDGLPAWSVEVTVRAGEDWEYQDSCNEITVYCKPLLHQPYGGMGRETGPWRGATNRYTFVDVPAQKPLVIWSWANDGDPKTLAVNAELVRSVDILTGD